MPLPTEELIIWANTDVNLPELAGPNKTKPIDDLINKGWDFKQKPAADEFNYILNNLGKWVEYLKTVVIEATPEATANTLALRDLNGDVAARYFVGDLNGNAGTATKWQTARTLALTGSVTGSVSVDGSGNVSMATAISPSSGVAILTGTVANGGTIPLPSGYSEGQCRWMVSMNNDNPSNTAWDWQEGVSFDHIHSHCSANGTRVVTCYRTVVNETGTQTHNGTANYIIIGVK